MKGVMSLAPDLIIWPADLLATKWERLTGDMTQINYGTLRIKTET